MKLVTYRLLVLIGLLLPSGCDRGGVESVHKTQGVTITVRHKGDYSTATTKSTDGVDAWATEEMNYGLDHMHVMLNGKDYGEVKAGDNVEIADGKVRVNGQQRTDAR